MKQGKKVQSHVFSATSLEIVEEHIQACLQQSTTSTVAIVIQAKIKR